jgi:hypothetical protein
MNTDCLTHRSEKIEKSTSINTHPRRKSLITNVTQHLILHTFDNDDEMPISKGSKVIMMNGNYEHLGHALITL